jgi:hypothetical protein
VGLFSPWFLAGLAALGLPIWLHLLRQFKRTPQPFSSLMFFERQIQSSSKHRRLRYITLLLLRLALLALLCLLFANPFLNRASNAVAPHKLTVIAVDRSFSMRDHTRLSDAKADAVRFIRQLPSGSSIQLLAFDSHAVPVTQPGTDKTAIIEALNTIDPSDEASSYGEFSRAMRVMEQTTGLGLDVHLFTDAQQTSMPAAFSDLQLGPHTALAIQEIGTGPSPNWAVQSVSVPAKTYDAKNIRLNAAIAGWQTGPVNRKVTVTLDGNTVASKEVSVPASGSAEVEFDNLTIPFGVHRGQVQIEPHDDLPADDTFLFSIERADPAKVLFLANAGRTADSFFYKSALDASTATGLKVQPSDTLSVELSQFALVVLNDPSELERGTAGALSDYVSKGGAILIAAGPATARSGVIPVSGNHITATGNSQGAQVKTSEILATDVFDNVQFLSTPRITPQAGDRILATFQDGSPILLEQLKGEGRILMFASTLDNSSSDFPIHSGFLPFVAATGAYLTGQTGDASSSTVGSAIVLRQSKSQSAAADVIGPDGKHEFPLSEGTRIISFNPLHEGFYDVHAANGKRRLVAVDADRRESNLEKIPAETLILWRNTSNGVVTASTAVVDSNVVQVSLWRYVLTFLLIAAIVESIFASRYLSEERQAS